MKKEIMAYLTALIDVYSETINHPMIKALNDVVTFVEDIPSENKQQSKMTEQVHNNLKKINYKLMTEKEILKKRLLKIEQANEILCTNTASIYSQINGLVENNAALNKNCNNLRKENGQLVKENCEFAQSNEFLHLRIIELRSKQSILAKLFKS